MQEAIRQIGLIFSAEAGLTRSVSAVGRVLIGLLAGLPPSALAISSTVSFTASALLEFPTGLLTDLFGRARASILGYLCQSAASLCLLFALVSFPSHPSLMWAFLIAEALLDATGNALASGSLEALFQEVISTEAKKLPAPEARRYEENALLQAEAHGRHVAFIAPLVGLSAALVLQARFGLAYLVLAVHAVGWVAVAVMIFRLAKRFGIKDHSAFDLKQRAALWRTGLRDFVFGFGHAGLSGIIGALGLFMNAATEGYFLVSVLREIALTKEFPVWAPALTITFMGATGQLARSYALPWMSKRFPNTALLALGLMGQVLLSIGMIGGLTFLGPGGKLVLLILYAPIFPLLAGFIIRPALGLLLVETRPEVHATLVSLRTAIALVLAGAYSSYLSLGSGVPSVDWIMVLNIAVSVIGLAILTFRFQHEGARHEKTLAAQ